MFKIQKSGEKPLTKWTHNHEDPEEVQGVGGGLPSIHSLSAGKVATQQCGGVCPYFLFIPFGSWYCSGKGVFATSMVVTAMASG
jgi:hypothetical protein